MLKIKRVVAYCRVSTEKDDQVNSLVSQVSFFKQYINSNEEWELVEIYADEGESGTSTKKRKAFNKMISDAELKLFDLILTKEISRFARNTLDSIFYTRKLKDLGVGVLFMNDNINTLDADGELRLTIMSSIAQEESRKTSERVKWGQKRQMEKGVVFGRNIMGYELKGGQLTIDEKEASIIKDIFDMYINKNMGTHAVAKELQNRGILTKNGGKGWSNAAIFKILKNEKYCGDLIQKKTYTPSYLTHEKKYNKGEEEFVVIKNHHDAIIDEETWKQAQKEIERRRTFSLENGKHSNRYIFSGKIKCGCCDSNFVGRTKKRKDGSIRKSWQCYTKTKYGMPFENEQGETIGCATKEVNDTMLQELVTHVLHDVMEDKSEIIHDVEQAVSKAIDSSTRNPDDVENILSEIEQAKSKKHKLVDLYLDNTLSKDDLKTMSEKYDKQIEFLQSKASFIKKQKEIISTQLTITEKINDTIKKIVEGNCFNEEVTRQALDKVVVFSKNEFVIYLKGGFNDVFGFSCDFLSKKVKNLDMAIKKKR